MTKPADKEARLARAREKAATLNLPPQTTENLARALVALGCEDIELDEAGAAVLTKTETVQVTGTVQAIGTTVAFDLSEKK